MKSLLFLLTVTSDLLVLTIVIIGVWLVIVGEPLLASRRLDFFPELCLIVLGVVGVTVILGVATSHRLGRKL